MEVGAITGHIDVAQVVLYVFWLFFAGLILYLLRENRREGYPLVSETDGKPMDHGLWMPDPKTFLLMDGTTVTVPILEKDVRDFRLAARSGPNGMPLFPTGEALMDGVGPGAYALRMNRPDMSSHGVPRLAPMRRASDFSLEERDPDPRGWTVIATDWKVAGTVADIWIDRAEYMARYFEVELASDVAPGRRVLLPVAFTQLNRDAGNMKVDALLASQFAGVPALADPDVVTLAEEDRICAYYGGGYFYAVPHRQETLL
jgi:photosynthetic reaction center H subunit